MRTITASFALVGVAICMVWSVQAAELRGTVSVGSAEHPAPARYVTRASTPHPQESTEHHIAVALERLDSTIALQVADTPLVVAQEHTAFAPDLLVVPVGGQVTFPNHDAIFHNVFSYSPPHSFDLGRYPKGQTRTIRFTNPGIVRIFCEIHSSMYGSILIVNTNTYRVINAGDSFDFPDLAPGKYRVTAVDAAGRRSIRELTLGGNDEQSISLPLE
jgi:plastocyanin